MIFESLHKFNGKEDVPLSLTQIKQIAGRAGRFGMQRTVTDGTVTNTDPLTPDESPAPGGSVTTLHKADLPLLKSLLPLPLPPITRATIDIPSPTLSALAALLPSTTTFAELLEHASELALLPAHTTLSANRHRVQLADIIEFLREHLTVKEMETFTFAPVQYRDQQSVSIFRKVVTAFAEEGRVDLMKLYTGTDLIQSLEVVEGTLKTLPPLSTIDNKTKETSTGGKSPTPSILVSSIPSLETLHKSLVMYIWLSFRYDVSLPDRSLAVEIKERVEKVLDECLARLPGLRKKKAAKGRLSTDKRGQDLPKTQSKDVGHQADEPKIKYLGKDQDQSRKRREVWRNVGLVNDMADATEAKTDS